MIRFIRDLRLVPITVMASVCLLALKAADFMLDSGPPNRVDAPAPASETIVRTSPGVPRPSDPQRSWAQQMFNFPDSSGGAPSETDLASLPVIPPLAADRNGDIITGSVAHAEEKNDAAKKGEGTAAEKGDAAGKDNKEGKPASAGKEGQPSNPPKDKQDGKVVVPDVRPLPSAAERALLERLAERRQQLDKRARELDIREGLIAEAEKRIEAKLAEIKDGEAQLATAAEKKDEAETARLKGLVTMYET